MVRRVLGAEPGEYLIGEPGHDGPAVYEGLRDALAVQGASVHIYGKKTTKPHRKMGHVTILDATREKALEKARYVRQRLKVKS